MSLEPPFVSTCLSGLLVIVYLLQEVLSEVPCSHQSIAQCFQYDNNDSLSQGFNEDFPLFDNITLNWICSRSYVTTEGCLERQRRSCPELYVNIHGTEHALEYLCHDGWTGYLDSRRCLSQGALQQATRDCNTTYNNNLNTVLRLGGSRAYQLGKLCQYMGEFLSCLREAAASHCGPAAGDWVYEFNKKLLSGALEQIQCPDSNTNNTAAIWSISIGVIVAVIGLIVIVLLTKKWIETRFQLRGSLKTQHSRGYSKASGSKSGLPATTRACETTYVAESPTKQTRKDKRHDGNVVTVNLESDTPVFMDQANQTDSDYKYAPIEASEET